MPEPTHISRLLEGVLTELTRRSEHDLDRWIDQARRLRGCASPIRLEGERLRVDAATGEIRSHYASSQEPGGCLLVACKNRRASCCAACSQTYRADTYQLVCAGVAGDSKGVPASVRLHPRVFVTLTAPSFGPVHRGPGKDGKTRVCHPRRDGVACFRHHRGDDLAIGQPLDAESYDYIHHVAWQAHAGELWRRFTVYLRRHLASAAGLSRTAFDERVRLSYAKVAEFQARGVVHFHAVIRLDGYTKTLGSWPPPPVWASLEMLTDAVASAARAVSHRVTVAGRTLDLVWGHQLDVRPIEAFAAGQNLTETAVAGYIAKYATKAAENTGTLDRRIPDIETVNLEEAGVRPHAARLIMTCWRLGNPHLYPNLEHLKLRRWAHMLGFRGHFATKSRRYSTTLGALRQARADYAAGYPWDTATHTPTRPDSEEDTTLVLGTWRYLGQGLTPGEMALASLVAGISDTEEGEVR